MTRIPITARSTEVEELPPNAFTHERMPVIDAEGLVEPRDRISDGLRGTVP